ncbi:hypothetical protein BaRGS_00013776 [Batillaria attramentaria]|uniref:Uncharacterized protein n=1 Tax=Batillaria attramentaria TaxID=370345 RepID=A0ABD0L616_9CAEN
MRQSVLHLTPDDVNFGSRASSAVPFVTCESELCVEKSLVLPVRGSASEKPSDVCLVWILPPGTAVERMKRVGRGRGEAVLSERGMRWGGGGGWRWERADCVG